MKKVHTSFRLREIMNELNLKQIDILNMAQPYLVKYGERLGKNDISQYVSGKTEPGQRKLFILAKALGVNPSWLMGLDVPKYELDSAAKNDAISDIIIKLRSDADLLHITKELTNMTAEQIQAVKTFLSAFNQDK